MFFETTPKARDLAQRINAFMDEHVYPNERRYFEDAEKLGPWKTYPVVEELKPKARASGLWNLFVPAKHREGGLTNFEYATLCEIMAGFADGRFQAPEGAERRLFEKHMAARPTRATWKRSCCTERWSNKRAGSHRCSKARFARALR